MVVTRIGGSGSWTGSDRLGPSETDIHDLIVVEVYVVVRQMIPNMSGSIKTQLTTMFDEPYIVVTESATATTTIVVFTAR